MERERERALRDRILSGDPEPFAEIVSSYQDLVASVVYRMGVPRQDIEDMTSEVFLKAYTRIDQFDPSYAMSTWLYRIATNHVLDAARRRKRTRAAALEDVAEPADIRPRAPESAETTERDRLLRAALATLPDDYRAVLTLKHVEDLPVAEIARVLEIPEGTVKIRLMRGRGRLRKALEAAHPEHFGSAAPAGVARGGRAKSGQRGGSGTVALS